MTLVRSENFSPDGHVKMPHFRVSFSEFQQREGRILCKEYYTNKQNREKTKPCAPEGYFMETGSDLLSWKVIKPESEPRFKSPHCLFMEMEGRQGSGNSAGRQVKINVERVGASTM